MSTAVLERKDLEEFKQVGAQLLANLEHVTKEREKLGAELAETKQENARLNARLDALEIALRRPQAEPSSAQEPSLVRKAFLKFLKGGNPRDQLGVLEPEEIKAWTEAINKKYRGKNGGIEEKAISIVDNTSGGYLLAPPEFVEDIIKKVVLISPVRAYANVIPTTKNVVERPKRTAVLTATWTTETGTRTDAATGASLKYGLEQQSTYEMYTLTLVSLQQMEDSAFDMDQVIQDDTSEQFARAEGQAFVSGSGNGQPEGLITNANVLANYSPSTSASALTYTGLVNLVHKLPSFYAPNARFAMHRLTVGAIRNLLDSNNRPLWLPNFGAFDAQNPATILGYPYFEAPDMPTVAANAFAVIFGDFKKGYTIVDRVQMTVQRLVEKYSDTGQIGIQIRKRVGGQVTNDEAFVVQKISVS